MKRVTTTTALLLALATAACAPAPEPYQPPPPVVTPGIDPVTGQPIDVTPGLNDREPDTCHAAEYQYLKGQNQSSVTAAGITRPTRFVTPGGIVSQEEYDSFRINFHLDPMGTVVRITCG
ncbi:MAG: hypothetical protein BGP11_07585 [Rhodobacterales bacterium 65-51]|jgi:hypothetical protein|uniref:I78 family peptidase inhibitor n=1 Tax=uncultured Gemmobacter sp. TaxID=1095917 RepID=UPI00095D7930|nr:I78 family peptidase inhibitor [uncultured Gemmobacter sp.]OJY36217.1 MAG: hypothetical protein BGP11_07585 [Rhodobacterales bacterium 65-51]